jgi:hypothetical protein
MGKRTAVAPFRMPVMEQLEFWQKMESMLGNYERGYAPVRWFRGWGGLTRGRDGYFVILKFEVFKQA